MSSFVIARKSALIITTEILNGVLGYVSLYFITRYMEPSDYGIVAFALGFVMLFSVFENMGFHHSHIKKVSEGKDPGVCNGTFLVTKIGLTFLLVVVILLSIFSWKFVLGRGFETPEHELAIYIMLGYMAVRSLAYFFNVTFKAKREIAKRQISIFFRNICPCRRNHLCCTCRIWSSCSCIYLCYWRYRLFHCRFFIV